MYKVYGACAMLVLGKRVSAHGFFEVQGPENVNIGTGCSINAGVFILGRGKTTIGNDVTLSARVMLIDAGLDPESKDRIHVESYVRIHDRVWIGAGAIVLPGVTIGEGSVVGAGSVVTKDIGPYSIAIGNPARVVKAIDRRT